MLERSEMPASRPIPAATILLVRDGRSGVEVFMVKRHHNIDFATGALVFPGGKVQVSDLSADAVMDGVAEWPSERRVLAAAAIREAFEEAGILLARDRSTGEFVDDARLKTLQRYRALLDRGETGLRDFADAENLLIAASCLVPFAHWITPAIESKRFDTYFFIARAPRGQIGTHDGRESVDSFWITPQRAIADALQWKLMFPTRLNLLRLTHFATVEAALADAGATLPLCVEPWVDQSPTGPIMRIRDDAGYDETWYPLRRKR